MGLVILSEQEVTEGECTFDKLEFRHADGRTVEKLFFIRLLRFIRIWKKLGWSIEHTDKVITALYPKQDPNLPEDQRLDNAFIHLLPRLAVIKRVIDALKLNLNEDLAPLLACFSPIDSQGSGSLYMKMFLSSAQKTHPVFADNGYGQFFKWQDTYDLLDYSETLRAAFKLTNLEFSQIVENLNFNESTVLNMDNISAIFRRGWLARKLNLNIWEFLTFTKVTGLDPFSLVEPFHSPVLSLVELVKDLRELSVKPEQILHFIWNQNNKGENVRNEREILEFARSLRDDFAAIEGEFAIGEYLDDTSARARMAQIYPNEAVDNFFGLLGNSVTTDVTYTNNQETLHEEILAAAKGTLGYDHKQKLLFFKASVMSDDIYCALKKVKGVNLEFKVAVDELYKKTRSFFHRYPELCEHFQNYIQLKDPVEKKLAKLVVGILPELQRRRKRQHVLQAIGSKEKVDIGFVSALLENNSVLHAAKETSRPALDDLLAMEKNEFILSLACEKLSINKSRTIGGLWDGYLETPETGFYNFYIKAKEGTTVELTINGRPVVKSDGSSIGTPIELLGGTFYTFSFKIQDTINPPSDGNQKEMMSPEVLWETNGRGWENIPMRFLYAESLINPFRDVYVRFQKAVSLTKLFKLTPAELVHLSSEKDYQIDNQGWLNFLPVATDDTSLNVGLLKILNGLVDFAKIKADLSAEDERFLSIIKDPENATKNSESLLFALARWEKDSLNTLLARFGKTVKDLAHLKTFRRVYDAYNWVKKFGIPAAALIKAVTNDPDRETVREFQSALRARFNKSDWLGVLKPINDEMRRLQRDALVLYILHQMRLKAETAHIDTPEKLFEYFLMDVQMEPCMQTSRIRHALSSVQLFIERCLMNLEQKVAPSVINVNQWQWMSRYRVWEANRKVFLYPENWLEPELRDDQSPFFKEVMSELLQSDITEDSAASALSNYLSKLGEVAKMEPCGIHYAEQDTDKRVDDIAHVVARTTGANRKYYYRRCEYGYWMPWEKIDLDIEDNPVIPVMWKGRLFLFWLQIVGEASNKGGGGTGGDQPIAQITLQNAKRFAGNSDLNIQGILCWSEYSNGKWQPTKTSDINKPTSLATNVDYQQLAAFRSGLNLKVYKEDNEVGNALQIQIFVSLSDTNQLGSFFIFYNSHSLPVRQEDTNVKPIYPDGWERNVNVSYDCSLKIQYKDGEYDRNYNLLKNHIKTHYAITPQHTLKNPWVAPFFYWDSRHVFYVSNPKKFRTMHDWRGYVPLPISKINEAIPPLVIPNIHIPKRVDPVYDTLDFGSKTPRTIERFIEKDTYIKKGIGTLGTITLGDKQIGSLSSWTKNND
ncbi:neuraminidase-like domain-containing protein [Bacillus cereus]|nr:neuraminidase-like domain-containing protein [Bacillus cereus]